MSKKIKYAKIIVDDVLFNLNKGVNYLEDKEVLTSSAMTWKIIVWFIVFEVAFNILYNILYGLATNIINSSIITTIIAIVLQGLAAFCIWECSMATAFKEKTINKKDVQTLMNYLMIFTVVTCLFNAISSYSKVYDVFDDPYQKAQSSVISEYILSDEHAAEYNAEREQLRKETYTQVTIVQIGVFAVYIGSLLLHKKMVSNYAV